MAVEQGEEQGAQAAVLVFSAQEDPFPGDEDVIEYDVGIHCSEVETSFESFSGGACYGGG